MMSKAGFSGQYPNFMHRERSEVWITSIERVIARSD